jgi:hypothetical protein
VSRPSFLAACVHDGDQVGSGRPRSGGLGMAVYCGASGLATLGAVEYAMQFEAGTRGAIVVAIVCIIALGAVADEVVAMTQNALGRDRPSSGE